MSIAGDQWLAVERGGAETWLRGQASAETALGEARGETSIRPMRRRGRERRCQRGRLARFADWGAVKSVKERSNNEVVPLGWQRRASGAIARRAAWAGAELARREISSTRYDGAGGE